jgi:hypothetical protein
MTMTKTFKQHLDEVTIKLKGFKIPEPSPAAEDIGSRLDAFIAEYKQGTTPNPFAPQIRVWQDSIGIELSKFGKVIHLSFITTFTPKNSGSASKALKWLTDLADKHGVAMDLIASPVKHAGSDGGKNLSKAQLVAWYKRHGFVGTASRMTRGPRRG